MIISLIYRKIKYLSCQELSSTLCMQPWEPHPDSSTELWTALTSLLLDPYWHTLLLHLNHEKVYLHTASYLYFSQDHNVNHKIFLESNKCNIWSLNHATILLIMLYSCILKYRRKQENSFVEIRLCIFLCSELDKYTQKYYKNDFVWK